MRKGKTSASAFCRQPQPQGMTKFWYSRRWVDSHLLPQTSDGLHFATCWPHFSHKLKDISKVFFLKHPRLEFPSRRSKARWPHLAQKTCDRKRLIRISIQLFLWITSTDSCVCSVMESTESRRVSMAELLIFFMFSHTLRKCGEREVLSHNGINCIKLIFRHLRARIIVNYFRHHKSPGCMSYHVNATVTAMHFMWADAVNTIGSYLCTTFHCFTNNSAACNARFVETSLRNLPLILQYFLNRRSLKRRAECAVKVVKRAFPGNRYDHRRY